MGELPNDIYQHWIHSHEEDANDTNVFRPSSYDFPLSRGREGFDIKDNGTFIKYAIAPDDKSEKVIGHWKSEGLNKIRVYFDDPQKESYILDIISIGQDILVVKKR